MLSQIQQLGIYSHLSREGGPAEPENELRRFIQGHGITALNVAGPRSSKKPEVGAFVKTVLERPLLPG
jgi:hypothetical protein